MGNKQNMKINLLRSKRIVDFDISTIEKGHNKMTYRNIPIRKCPFDYVLYQMLIYQLMPDLIIEIGTDKGGSTLYLADILNTLNNGIIHSIDIKAETNELINSNSRIKLFTEGWENYNINMVRNFNRVLIIEDSTHSYSDTLSILNKFSNSVTLGSYIIIEDGIIDELGVTKLYGGGPLKAIKEFLKENKNFIIDEAYCNFFGKNATFNVNGYLKRINA